MKKKCTAILLTIMMCLTVFAMYGCNEEIIDHNIFVTSSNIRYGTVTGEGYYKTKTNVLLTATANEGHYFVCWVKDGIIVSSDAEYSFEASRQTEGKYTAVFHGQNMQHYQLKNFILYFNSLDETPDNYYELLNINLTQKINFVATEIFNHDTSQLFQKQNENYLLEIPIENQFIYNSKNTYEFTLYIKIKNPEGLEQTYTNNLIINFEDSNLNGLTLNFSDSNLLMSALFNFEPLSTNE